MRNMYRILFGKQEGRIRLVDVGVYGKEILKWTLKEMGCDEVTGFILLRISDQWRHLVNMVMNRRIPEKSGNFLTK
jgi:hypothetical protein